LINFCQNLEQTLLNLSLSGKFSVSWKKNLEWALPLNLRYPARSCNFINFHQNLELDQFSPEPVNQNLELDQFSPEPGAGAALRLILK
jgi:hypothetical protein